MVVWEDEFCESVWLCCFILEVDVVDFGGGLFVSCLVLMDGVDELEEVKFM